MINRRNHLNILSAAVAAVALAACGSESGGSSSSSSSSSSNSSSSSSTSSASSSSSSSSSTSSGVPGAGGCDTPVLIDGSPMPYCQTGALADPDGDGWGWENEASCVVPNGSADPAPGTCVVDIPEPGGGESPNRVTFRGEQVFLNGANVAWLDFATDFGTNPNIADDQAFDTAGTHSLLDGVNNTGGNSVRWWVHTDGSASPEWGTVNGQRLVVAPGDELIEDLRAALDAAATRNMYIVPALWSFDMLRDNDYRQPPTQDNYRLLSDDAVLQSYIDNALVPLVQALNDHPALFAWELFNEPENMTESWFSAEEAYYGGPVPTRAQLVRTQAKMAAAIHRAAAEMGSTALVTTGSKSLGKYNSDVAGGSNWYADGDMIAAADGDTLAVLDFYEPHYYNNEGRDGAWSPFEHPAEYWGLDKPIVIGEFYITGSNAPTSTTGGSGLQAENLCKTLEDLGYAGAWPWQWNERATEIGSCISRTFD